MGWMANTDIQPATTLHGLIEYAAKYTLKPEKKTISYQDLQTEVLHHTNDSHPVLSFTSRMLNKLIVERDWSAQEVSHILLQLPLTSSSRVVVTLDCRPETEAQQVVTFEDGSVKAQASAYDRYKKRLTPEAVRAMKNGPVDLTNLTLLDWLQHFDFYSWKRRPAAKPRVINYFPRYKADPDLDMYEDYCRVKLMLHHAFIEVDDLLRVESFQAATFTAAFLEC
jgi:hypothetical protein